jgi:hypothetical protein
MLVQDGHTVKELVGQMTKSKAYQAFVIDCHGKPICHISIRDILTYMLFPKTV